MFTAFVPEGGLEPPRLATHAPEACTSTNSVTRALHRVINFKFNYPVFFSSANVLNNLINFFKKVDFLFLKFFYFLLRTV